MFHTRQLEISPSTQISPKRVFEQAADRGGELGDGVDAPFGRRGRVGRRGSLGLFVFEGDVEQVRHAQRSRRAPRGERLDFAGGQIQALDRRARGRLPDPR